MYQVNTELWTLSFQYSSCIIFQLTQLSDPRLDRESRCCGETAALLEVKEAGRFCWCSHQHVSLVLVSYVDL